MDRKLRIATALGIISGLALITVLWSALGLHRTTVILLVVGLLVGLYELRHRARLALLRERRGRDAVEPVPARESAPEPVAHA
jgi:uncharacterized membrane protein YqjE